MLNKSTSRSEHVVQSIETPYPIGFAFQYNGDGTPQIRVTIGDMVAKENEHFVISEDSLSIKLLSLGENGKWVGSALVIERDIPFVQESDYQVGRISPEQIEKDFDLSVMRDQVLGEQIKGCTDGMQGEIDALHSRIDYVQEEHASDMAAVDAVMATKATKAELENAKTTLNSHTNELTTLRDQVSGIEEKIPESASGSNPLVTKAELANIDLDGYVKKSGDTITGILTIQDEEDNDLSTPPVGGLSFKSNASPNGFTNRMRQVGNGFIAIEYLLNGKQYANLVFGDQQIYLSNTTNGTGNPVSLGTSGNPWNNVYAKKLNNGADIAIPTEGGTLARLEDLEGLGGGDYLPLSGGEMTGDILMSNKGRIIFGGKDQPTTDPFAPKICWKEQNILQIGDNTLFFSTAYHCLMADADGSRSLGRNNVRWKNVYTKSLNNGADLAVPTTGGTLARVEDIDAVVGDISTALTAILGE